MNNGGKSSIGFDDHFLKAEFLLLLFTTFKQISQMLNLMCLVIDGFVGCELGHEFYSFHWKSNFYFFKVFNNP